MSCAYVVLRGALFHFRIRVPNDLVSALGRRELRMSLGGFYPDNTDTSEKSQNDGAECEFEETIDDVETDYHESNANSSQIQRLSTFLWPGRLGHATTTHSSDRLQAFVLHDMEQLE
jgi:hypothetical protein